jgi:hypothetical protein
MHSLQTVIHFKVCVKDAHFVAETAVMVSKARVAWHARVLAGQS